MQIMKGWCKMMVNEIMTSEQKCIELVCKLNDKALSTVLMFLEGVADQERHLKTTPVERIREIEEQIKRKDEEWHEEWEAEKKAWEAEQREQLEQSELSKEELQNWIDKKTKGVKVPDGYDICITDLTTLYNGIKYNFDDMFLDTIITVYDYGFKRGCNYIKKKALATPTK